MCYDEMRNGKAKHETLFNVNLKDKVIDKEKDSYPSLETLLINAKKNEHNLFLAVEKGAGKFENDVTVMMNPKTKEIARKWLVEEYLQQKFQEEKMLKTSIDPEEWNVNSKCNESLKNF